MNPEILETLEFNKIQERLLTFAVSHLGKERITNMRPSTDVSTIRLLLQEVDEAKRIIGSGGSVPIPSLEGIESIMEWIGKGHMLTARDMGFLSRLLESTTQLKRYMARKEEISPRVASYAQALDEMTSLHDEIRRCVAHEQILDQASPELGRIRKRIAIVEDRIRKKLESTMQKYRSQLQAGEVSMRNGRYVIPVKKEFKRSINGVVLDESASGQTVWLEPSDIAALQGELSAYRSDEVREESRILGYLTGLVEMESHKLTMNLETIGHYDFLFAKAKYAKAIDARTVELNVQGKIRLKEARHPLVEGRMVPLDFAIGRDYQALIITGPNTGGKTVCLKTVGLLTLMAQSGLHVPVGADSELAVFTQVAADIGDGQSLEHALSTFSSHINQLIKILSSAGPSTMVLLDEMAAGTDPGEGIGLAIAVLEELYRRGATIVATTHFHEIKLFAQTTPGFENARMEFDVEHFQPLYRLRIGEAGQSYALMIAERLGMPTAIIGRSKEMMEHYRVKTGAFESEPDAQGPGKAEVEPSTPTETDRLGTHGSTATLSAEESIGSSAEPVTADSDDKRVSMESHLPDQGGREGTNRFVVGDVVWIHTLKRTGTVSESADARGMVSVLVQGERIRVNRKRLSLYIDKKELYPEGYDMDIVLESKEVRKRRKLMGRKYVKGLSIEYPPDDKN